MTTYPIKFRHHQSGTPRPNYRRKTIAPLPEWPAFSLRSLLASRDLIVEMHKWSAAMATARLQIKPPKNKMH